MSRRVVVTLIVTAAIWSPTGLGCASPAPVTGDRESAGPAPSRVGSALAPLVAYQPPVAASVRDRFRPPASPFGPGNRGIEYATAPGQPVWAAADGVVVFAGAVGGRLAVSIEHADGLRTTYTHLGEIAVSAGARVGRGQVIGSATDRMHFGARLGSAYLDPAGLFEAGSGPARLVPDHDTSRRGRPPDH